jgi:hypothetical protein
VTRAKAKALFTVGDAVRVRCEMTGEPVDGEVVALNPVTAVVRYLYQGEPVRIAYAPESIELRS